MSGSEKTVFLKCFSAGKVEAARGALQKLQKRLGRAATKTGQVAPAAPTLTVTRIYVFSRCLACGCGEEGFAGGSCMACKKGTITTRNVVDLELTFEKPALAGWEFLAVVEPLEGGNLVKTVPGSDTEGFDSTAYRTGAIKCDHCNTVRKRTETFVVRSTGENDAYPAGCYRQVGRNCLEAFLGGKSPAAIVASLDFEKVVRGEDEEFSGGGWGGEPVYNPAEFLAWTAASVREYGWTSRGAARDSFDGKQATADHVLYLLVPPFGDKRGDWAKDVALCTPTTEEVAKGAAALEWAKNLEGKNDYELNLRLVAAQPGIGSKHAGILASAISAYERFRGNQVKYAARAAAKAASEFVGTVKDKVVVTATVEAVFDFDTQFGVIHVNKLRDEAGNTLVWKTGTCRFDTGKTVTLKGTIKAHTEYKGEKQTELTRCKEV